ncbi:MAG: hypothetical protein EZS28_027712 [Streblomastix strix]|uniref:Uncharacterized protein n=1 Tax=Streblomastix strix TaxID=222440 RepID=A0A5J4V325_9EUKA|nr:MAG: hypothetical protein EZS28_027712 [Streblomastix strix]
MSKYYDNLPEWALKFKTRGRNVKRLNGHYYLYRCTTLYDKKTRVRKPTQIYLGYITENGLVRIDDATCTEYGYPKVMLLKGSALLMEMKNQYGEEQGFNLFKQIVRRYSERSYLTETMENLGQIDNRYIASFEELRNRLSSENPKLYLLK